jgi:hypothetical protein
MAAGAWDLQLVEDTPRRILEDIDIESAGFGQLVILPARLDPRAHTDATLLSLARYTGIFRKQEGDFRLSGPGLPILLGDEDNKGDIYEVERSTANGWLTQWATALRPVSLEAGTTYSPGGAWADSFYLVTAKEAFETLKGEFNAPIEWRVTPDFKWHVGTVFGTAGINALYDETPRLIVLHNAGTGGRDFGVTGVQGVSGMDRDLEDYTTKVVYKTEVTTTTNTEVVTDVDFVTPDTTTDTVTESSTETVVTVAATADVDIPFSRPTGGPVILDRLIEGDSNDGSDADPQAQADMQLGRFDSIRREIKVDYGDYEIGHIAPVGSYVWLYAPPVVMDAASPVQFRGRVCYPVKVRLMGCTWPISRGLGVYMRITSGEATRWVDLTDYVAWESGEVGLEVDSLPRPSSD